MHTKTTGRRRADLLLVERGLFESRAKAQAAIAAGFVTADDVVVVKSSTEIPVDATLRAASAHPYVSRGGVKLAAALDALGYEIAGRVCLDVGASTGGFTDVLLARGARRVYAVDVGHGQLHTSLRERAEVTVFEDTDIRTLDAARLPEPPDIVVVDVSFISLKKVLPAALALAAPRMNLIALIKPQFEVGPERVGKRGVVRDAVLHREVCERIAQWLEGIGWHVEGIEQSPIQWITRFGMAQDDMQAPPFAMDGYAPPLPGFTGSPVNGA